LSNITIRCNGFNDIELIDQNGNYYYYCDYKPASVVNFGGNRIRWISITRYGQSSFTLNVQFSVNSTITNQSTSSVQTTQTSITTTPVSIITNVTSSN
jgi:hypothetical protein